MLVNTSVASQLNDYLLEFLPEKRFHWWRRRIESADDDRGRHELDAETVTSKRGSRGRVPIGHGSPGERTM